MGWQTSTKLSLPVSVPGCKTNTHPFADSFFTLKKEKISGHLDTLAQVARNNEKSLIRKVHRKAITSYISGNLICLDTENKKAYRNMYYCNRVLQQDGKTLVGTYCKNRFCLVCNAIKTANLIDGYKPVIEKFKDAQFLTLTIVSVKENDLKSSIDQMGKTFTQIRKHLTKYHRIKFQAIRKLECNYNQQCNTYNPHFHLIIDGESNAKLLRDLWLLKNPGTNVDANKYIPADLQSLKELFKYATKLVSKSRGLKSIHFYSLDKIYSALQNRRIIQPIGLKKIIIDEDAREKIEYQNLTDDKAVWHYKKKFYDYCNEETGELLTGYQPDPEYLEIFERSKVKQKARDGLAG